jgi:heme/copper-type cytochrome/quinol oxidase subunit 2
MAKTPPDPMIAALQAAQREERAQAARARRAALMRRTIAVVITLIVAAAVTAFILAHRQEVADQTPPADCTGRAQDIGCGGVVPAP